MTDKKKKDVPFADSVVELIEFDSSKKGMMADFGGELSSFIDAFCKYAAENGANKKEVFAAVHECLAFQVGFVESVIVHHIDTNGLEGHSQAVKVRLTEEHSKKIKEGDEFHFANCDYDHKSSSSKH